MSRVHLSVPASGELFLAGVAADTLFSGENASESSVALSINVA